MMWRNGAAGDFAAAVVKAPQSRINICCNRKQRALAAGLSIGARAEKRL